MKGREMTGRIWGALVLAMATTGTAAAQDRVSIVVADVKIEAPMPEGYCLPTGKDKVVTDLIAAADTENLTHASLVRCDRVGKPGGLGNDYYLIKTPRRVLLASVSRPELLAALEKEFGKAEWQAGGRASTEVSKKVNEDLTETFSSPVEVKGDFSGRGADSDCAYLGGEAIVSLGGVTYPIQAGACMTSVSNKMIIVYTYDDPKGTDGVVRLMRKAQALAMAFRPAAGDKP